MYHVSRLDSGLTVATAEMPHMTSVSVGLWIGVGSRYEPPKLNGICHFIEHMVFKGTHRRTAKEISQAVEGIGGSLNAFTSEETTCFHAKASHERFEQLLDVLADLLLHPLFAPADLAKERGVIKEEIAMCQDEPQHLVQELLNAVLWPGQPLGRPILGSAKTLDRMGRARLADYLRRNYVAGNVILSVAGNVTHRRVLRAFRPYARRFPRGVAPRFDAAAARQSQPRVRLLTRKTEQTQLALGLRACSRHDPRRYALRLLNTLLGENMSSRLFQVLREDRALAYSIYSTPSFFHDTGDLVISAGLDAANLPIALRLILRELRRLIDPGPDAAELRRARDYLLGQIDLALEGTENQMNWLGEQLVGYGNVETPDHAKKHLLAVTRPEIRRAARDFFRADRLNLALVSPLKKATGVQQELERGL